MAAQKYGTHKKDEAAKLRPFRFLFKLMPALVRQQDKHLHKRRTLHKYQHR
jgi:hypothetical protein